MLRLAGLLAERFEGGRAFFCNSGAEANEAALKIARKATGRTRIVALEGGFHGRTLGSLSATGQPAKWEGFGPLLPGVAFARPNDDRVARGGARAGRRHGADPARAGARRGWRDPARARVRAGRGRAGQGDRRPPLRRRDPDRDGADGHVLRLRAARDRARSRHAREGSRERAARWVRCWRASGLRPASSPATTAPPSAATRSPLPRQSPSSRRSTTTSSRTCASAATRSRPACEALPAVAEVRGRGLLLGAELDRPVGPVVDAAREHGLLVLSAGPDVLRLTPPLVVSADEVEQALGDPRGGAAREPPRAAERDPPARRGPGALDAGGARAGAPGRGPRRRADDRLARRDRARARQGAGAERTAHLRGAREPATPTGCARSALRCVATPPASRRRAAGSSS